MTESGTEIIVEKLDVKNPTVLTSFPGIGLVGTIASAHLITEYKLDSIGYIDAKDLPPIATLLDGVVIPPIRIYQVVENEILIIHSDVPIKEEVVYDLVHRIVTWASGINARRIFSMAGVATFEGKNRVFGAATSPELLDELKEHVEIFKTGTISGIAGSLLNECVIRRFPGLILLGETYGFNPDPRAAAQVVEALNKIFGMDVGVERLIKEAEFIEAQMQKLAEQTKVQEEKEVKKEEFPMFG
jgi:uncharacterized protein